MENKIYVHTICSNYTTTIGVVKMNKIKQIREQKGLSRYQVAKVSGVWYKNLIDIENGKDVTLSTLRKIAAAMNCEVSDLV